MKMLWFFDDGLGYSYDGCIIGVSSDRRAIYSYKMMVQYLIEKEEMTESEAVEWIDYNTLRALCGGDCPIVMEFDGLDID